jgi:hypothetical protein
VLFLFRSHLLARAAYEMIGETINTKDFDMKLILMKKAEDFSLLQISEFITLFLQITEISEMLFL